MTEERKEGQIAPEVAAAWKKLKHHAEALLRIMNDQELDGIAKYDAELVRDWGAIVLSDDVPQAFWLQALEDVSYWLQRIKEGIEVRNIEYALRYAKPLQRCLGHYAELLGLEIPPEEEEAPVAEVPSADEEVGPEVIVEEPPAPEPVEGTPLRVLELSTRVHNILCRRCPHPEGQRLFVEDVLKVLEEEREIGLLALKDFGKKALEETLAKLRAKGFLSEESETESFAEVLERIQRPF